MKKRKIIPIILIAIIIIGMLLGISISQYNNETKLISVKSKQDLLEIYNGKEKINFNPLIGVATMPFSLIYGIDDFFAPTYAGNDYYWVDSQTNNTLGSSFSKEDMSIDNIDSAKLPDSATSAYQNHSTTNIQVENVDEADIIKTDGNYIYSISEDDIVITNAKDPENLKIIAKIQPTDNYVPEDIILYKNKLVVISTQYISYNKNTFVNVYDITIKEQPKLEESYVLNEEYYTSRCIDGKLLVIASGRLRKEDNEIITYYTENNRQKEIELSNIKYLKGLESKQQTLIATLDLNKNNDVEVNSYLFDVKNAYVSEKNMYLINQDYDKQGGTIGEYFKCLFNFGGIIGFFKDIDEIEDGYAKYTNIYKFKINDNGTIEYKNNTKVKGTTINQFSLDEYNENLRIGLNTTEGSRVVVFDKNLQQIGETPYLSKGEKMYSTRFIGDKAYMVTYRNTDPLYVIDLSNPTNPKVLGKLKIPGYSTYLQPYDENHLIGIGMQTEERTYKDSSGKVINTFAVVTGMKMALFDVSDVNNPIQISQTIIGDSRTTSAILTNHKALLFSAEKGIIAIPVNKYPSDVEINIKNSDISTMVDSYKGYSNKYNSEGYFVYNINLTDGFKLKGVIEHEKTKSNTSYGYTNSRLLRGMWIKDNLFTVSEDMIKVNKLEDLSQIFELRIKEEQ